MGGALLFEVRYKIGQTLIPSETKTLTDWENNRRSNIFLICGQISTVSMVPFWNKTNYLAEFQKILKTCVKVKYFPKGPLDVFKQSPDLVKKPNKAEKKKGFFSTNYNLL